MDITKVKQYITGRMKEESGLDHYYHNLEHTLDVWRSVVRLCRMEEVSEKDQLLIETAALYHDIGMLETYINHEDASIIIARESLPGFGYTQDEVDTVTNMILTTKLPQSASSLNEMILCDADLDYLGREDFFMIAERLRYEWNVLKIKPTTLLEWYELQVIFLEEHNFFTESAQTLRNEGKANNLKQIKALFNHR
jgi:predicted metal-dependent HD superfamily phosphohydrolase